MSLAEYTWDTRAAERPSYEVGALFLVPNWYPRDPKNFAPIEDWSIDWEDDYGKPESPPKLRVVT